MAHEISPLGSTATQAMILFSNDAQTELEVVCPANPLPVTGTITPSGTQDTNLIQVAGASVATGHGTASGTIRVELPTDGTGVVGLNAGSNVIGHVIADTGSTTAVTGNVTVIQPTGTSLHAVLDTTSTTAVTQATAGNLNATIVGTGTLAVQNTAATPAGTNNIGQVTPVKSTTMSTTQVTVPATANGILLLASNANRLGAIISNPGAVAVYYQQAATGVTTSNGGIIPAGGVLSIDGPLYTGALYGIIATSTQVVSVTEFTA